MNKTVIVGREPNMPSLARVLSILCPVPVDHVPAHLLSGMDVAPAGSVRITGRCAPTMGRDDACRSC